MLVRLCQLSREPTTSSCVSVATRCILPSVLLTCVQWSEPAGRRLVHRSIRVVRHEENPRVGQAVPTGSQRPQEHLHHAAAEGERRKRLKSVQRAAGGVGVPAGGHQRRGEHPRVLPPGTAAGGVQLCHGRGAGEVQEVPPAAAEEPRRSGVPQLQERSGRGEGGHRQGVPGRGGPSCTLSCAGTEDRRLSRDKEASWLWMFSGIRETTEGWRDAGHQRTPGFPPSPDSQVPAEGRKPDPVGAVSTAPGLKTIVASFPLQIRESVIQRFFLAKHHYHLTDMVVEEEIPTIG